MVLIFNYMSANKSFHICMKLSLGMVQLGFSLRIETDEALLKHLRPRTVEKMTLALDLRHSWWLLSNWIISSITGMKAADARCR